MDVSKQLYMGVSTHIYDDVLTHLHTCVLQRRPLIVAERQHIAHGKPGQERHFVSVSLLARAPCPDSPHQSRSTPVDGNINAYFLSNHIKRRLIGSVIVFFINRIQLTTVRRSGLGHGR